MDKQSVGVPLAVLAMVLMVGGVFTNSWWKVQRGWHWQGVGLLEQKFCRQPPGRSEHCQAVKHKEVRKTLIELSRNWAAARQDLVKMLDTPRFKRASNQEELQRSVERLDEMLGNIEDIDITIGDGSWITMGKLVYYGTFAVLILLAFAVTLSRIFHERAALLAKLAAGGCFALLTVSAAFVFRVPDYINHAIPAYVAGYSQWMFWIGASAGTAGGVLLAMAAGESVGRPVGVGLPEYAAGRDAAKNAASTDSTCPQCGARPDYREDINCYICPKCRINV